MRAILAGGPRHGAVYDIQPGHHDLVFVANFPVGQLFTPAPPQRPPKPSWWTYLFHYDRWAREYADWKYWEPKTPTYAEPLIEQIVYRLRWQGNPAIFWYEGALAAPPASATEIFQYLWTRLQEARYSDYRLPDRGHWELGQDWYAAIWRSVFTEPVLSFDLGGQLRDHDRLIGIPVKITGPTGAPRIVENERVEAIR